MKKTLIALMALASVACGATSSTSAVDNISLPIGGNYYADSFEFTFTITDDVSGVYDIVGLYHGRGGGSVANLNCFVLSNVEEGGITLSLVRAYDITNGINYTVGGSYDVTNDTTYTTNNNESTFVTGESATVTLLSKNIEYTVKYLGGGNDAAAAELYSGETLIGSFTGGQFNLSGGNGGTAAIIWKSNENYVTSVTASGKTYFIPEPATATLSLLALASLAARRRRC